MPVAYRIETENTVIRCYNPPDALKLKNAIDMSLEHLRPWMPWAKDEPQPLEAKIERMRKFRGMFDLDQDYIYGIFTRDEAELMGGTGLHTRIGDDAREIGYWISTKFANRGITTEVVSALVKVGFEMNDLSRIEIRCDPKNIFSAKIPQKLGFVHEATLRNRIIVNEIRDVMIWTLFRDDYEKSGIKNFPLKAFDGYGKEILTS